MEYTISGIIKFSEEIKLKLDNRLILNTSNFIKIHMLSTDTNDLSIEFILSADHENEAKMRAELELERISNLISYFRNIPIAENKITGITSQFQNAPNQQSIKISESICLSERSSIVNGLGEESIKKLKNKLEGAYSNGFEEMAHQWRQAISKDNPPWKYLQLYKILELLFNNNTKSLTDWIKTKEPQVEMYHDRKRGKHTIYTYLRDCCVHWKAGQEALPEEQISSRLGSLQNLVYRRIQEKYGESIYWDAGTLFD